MKAQNKLNLIKRLSPVAILIGISATLYAFSPRVEYTPAPIEAPRLIEKSQISSEIEQKVQVQLPYMISQMKRRYGDNSNYNPNNPNDRKAYDSILETIADHGWVGIYQFEDYLKSLPRVYIAPEFLEEWKRLKLEDGEPSQLI